MSVSKALLITLATAISISTYQANAQDIVPPTVYSLTPTGVNVSDGGFTYSNTDLSIGTLSLERYWLGGGLHDPNTPPFGVHMNNNFDIYFREHQYTTKPPNATQYFRGIVHMGNFASSTYDIVFAVSPTFISPFSDDAYSGVLELSGNAYVYTDQNGTVYTFDPNVPVNGAAGLTQRVANIAYPNGRKLTFSYDSGHNLKLVTDNNGYAIVFDTSGSVVATACGFNLSQTYVSTSTTCSSAPLKTSYGYTSGVLTSFTDVDMHVTSYGYTSNELTCITPPGYSTCKILNTYVLSNSFYQVSQQTLADGSIWKFFGGGDGNNNRNPDGPIDQDGNISFTVTDPNNKISTYSFTKSSPYIFVDANGKTTQYRYTGGKLYEPNPSSANFGSMLVEVDLPEGNQYRATYDPTHFNLPVSRTMKAKPGSGLADLTEQIQYPSCASPNTRQNCVKPIWTKDAKGNQTDYVYTSYGSIQSEMQPAPSSGAARPLKLFTYLQRYAYIKNSGGSLVAAASPIWMPDTETQCQTVAGSSVASCDPTAPITTTSYEYGTNGTANNLLVRGKVVSSGGLSLRTCYGYDNFGNKIWETSPRAGLAVCS